MPKKYILITLVLIGSLVHPSQSHEMQLHQEQYRQQLQDFCEKKEQNKGSNSSCQTPLSREAVTPKVQEFFVVTSIQNAKAQDATQVEQSKVYCDGSLGGCC